MDLRSNPDRDQQPLKGSAPTRQPGPSWQRRVCGLSGGGCGRKCSPASPHLDVPTWTGAVGGVCVSPSPAPVPSGRTLEVCLNSDPFSSPPFHQILSCGQPAATGSAWMDSLRRPRHPRGPGRRPIPTRGTAPSLLQQAQSRAARPVGPTSQTWPGR